MIKTILAQIARRGGGKLLDGAVGKVVKGSAGAPSAKSTILGTLAGAALTRIATKSVPGAILVGGGLLAKTLYDRRRAGKAAPQEAEHDGT
jgi:hypothetical protein